MPITLNKWGLIEYLFTNPRSEVSIVDISKEFPFLGLSALAELIEEGYITIDKGVKLTPKGEEYYIEHSEKKQVKQIKKRRREEKFREKLEFIKNNLAKSDFVVEEFKKTATGEHRFVVRVVLPNKEEMVVKGELTSLGQIQIYNVKIGRKTYYTETGDLPTDFVRTIENAIERVLEQHKEGAIMKTAQDREREPRRRPVEVEEERRTPSPFEEEVTTRGPLAPPTPQVPERPQPERLRVPPQVTPPAIVLEEKTFAVEEAIKGYKRLVDRLEENVEDTIAILRRKRQDDAVHALQFWLDTAHRDLRDGIEMLKRKQLKPEEFEVLFEEVLEKLMDISDEYNLGIEVAVGKEVPGRGFVPLGRELPGPRRPQLRQPY